MKPVSQDTLAITFPILPEAEFRDKKRDLCAWSGFQYKFNSVNFYLELKSFNTKTNTIKVKKTKG